MDRIRTGISGLDEVLQGGLPVLSTTIVAGSPGTGKTILARQMLYSNPPSQKALYASTLSEPQIKVLRFLQGFSFFQQQRFMDSVLYQDLGSILADQGPRR